MIEKARAKLRISVGDDADCATLDPTDPGLALVKYGDLRATVSIPPEGEMHRVAMDIMSAPVPAVVALALGTLGPGATCWDLGAHLGAVSIQAALRGAAVVAIEGGRSNHAHLLRTASYNPSLDLLPIFAAIGEVDGAMTAFSENGPHGGAFESGSDHVLVRTIDSLAAELETGFIDVLKMDVEGSETAALRGIKKLSGQIGLMVVECNLHTLVLMGTSRDAVFAEFERLGMTAYRMTSTGLAPVGHAAWQPDTLVDYLVTSHVASVGFTTRAPLTDDEIAQMFLADIHVNEPHRVAGLKNIKDAPSSITGRADIRECLASIDEAEPVPPSV